MTQIGVEDGVGGGGVVRRHGGRVEIKDIGLEWREGGPRGGGVERWKNNVEDRVSRVPPATPSPLKWHFQFEASIPRRDGV